MITEQLKDILMSKRILRDDPVGDIWIHEYFQEAIRGLEITNIEILVCNSLQRQCSCATMRDKKVIVLDNYLSELFMIFNQILYNEDDSKYLEPFFYKLVYESYFLGENIELAAIYKTLMINKFREIGTLQIKQVTRSSKPQYLYAQQAFLVMHEIMHSFFKDSPEAYATQKKAVSSVLDKVFYHREIGHIQMVSDAYLEELCCDHLAAISAISISTEHGHCSELDASCAIIMALHYHFLLLCIDRIVEGSYLSDKVGEFAIRVTIIRLFVSNYFKVNNPELVDSVINNISDKVDVWKKRFLVPFSAFMRTQKLNESKYNRMKLSDEKIAQLRRNLMKGF